MFVVEIVGARDHPIVEARRLSRWTKETAGSAPLLKLSDMSIQADVHSFREVVPPNAKFVGMFDWLCRGVNSMPRKEFL
jgi:hypothetical protein